MTNTPAKTGWKRYIYGSSTNAADHRNQLRFTAWVFFWGVSFVVATKLLKSDTVIATPLTWLIILIPTVLGLAALLSYLKFLRNTDEMLRKIQMEGLAIGFAVGVLGSWSYSLLETVGAPKISAVDLSAVMMITWALGQLYGTWRYR
ncbi:MAG: hypothetical protein HKM98_06535 [Gammaproteobacteria bacterium]|nr:hypothetical protein [Gammaproteobacteria bacterium]